MPDDEMTQRLRTRLGRAQAERRAIVERAGRESRANLTPDESAKFDELGSEITKFEERITELREDDQRTARSDAARARVGGGRATGAYESRVYNPDSGASYLRDLTMISRNMGDHDAQERMQAYSLEQRDLNRADGSGGAFVPPAWLTSEYVGLPRAGRVAADLLTRRPLPPGTDSINIPKVLTGTSTAIQPADNDPVTEVDLTDSSIVAPVRTIAGQQDVALQLLDQSPVNFDEIVFRDLLADHAAKTDAQVLSGAGTLGTLLGLRNVVGAEQVTFTSAAPTLQEMLKRVADASSRMSSALYVAPNVIVMHPRRWAWVTMQTDSSLRPMIVPESAGPHNAAGTLGQVGGEGRVGQLGGIDVYVDAGLPTNVATNQDVILVLNSRDSILFESTVRTRVLPEVLSGTLTVRLQLWSYVALATRQAKSVSIISGSGLVSPVFT